MHVRADRFRQQGDRLRQVDPGNLVRATDTQGLVTVQQTDPISVVFALPAMRRGYQRLAKWIDGVAGVLFTGFGLHLIFTR